MDLIFVTRKSFFFVLKKSNLFNKLFMFLLVGVVQSAKEAASKVQNPFQ
jgi:hypothetical protein